MTIHQLTLDVVSHERLEEIGRRASMHANAVAALATRLVLGFSFVLTGKGKLEHFDRTVQFFSDIGIPFATANAGFVAGLELVGGIALMLGAGTRAFAALLSTTMVVALLTADGATLADALLLRDSVALTDVTSLVFLVFLLWLIGMGPGRLSVDALVRKFSAS